MSDLTPQELQIALRLAAGRTTREAATALFLSPKTIEYHLRNIYRKLAVSSRSELATAMQRLTDRQEALDHEVDLLGDLELEEMTCADGLAERDRRIDSSRYSELFVGTADAMTRTGNVAVAQDAAASNAAIAFVVAIATSSGAAHMLSTIRARRSASSVAKNICSTKFRRLSQAPDLRTQRAGCRRSPSIRPCSAAADRP